MFSSQNDLQNLQDAEDEMMIALDSDEKVPFMVGEVFIMKSQVSLNLGGNDSTNGLRMT